MINIAWRGEREHTEVLFDLIVGDVENLEIEDSGNGVGNGSSEAQAVKSEVNHAHQTSNIIGNL